METLRARPPWSCRPRSRRSLQRLACSVAPSLSLSAEETFAVQWHALQQNDCPHTDAGIELVYRFADVDLYLPRSRFFGVSQDLGQFERFRRCFQASEYRVLLSHVRLVVLSNLLVSEEEARQRVLAFGFRGDETATYTMTLRRKLGGAKDGVWLTASLLCEQYDPVRRPNIDDV